MSVSLQEVLESAGFDISKNIDDARWLISQKDEFEELVEKAEDLEEAYGEYEYFEEYGDNSANPLSFEEWLEQRDN